jgi:hypothetical protein
LNIAKTLYFTFNSGKTVQPNAMQCKQSDILIKTRRVEEKRERGEERKIAKRAV